MDAYLVWLLLGLALVIVELLTGTFYLLVLGEPAYGEAISDKGGMHAARGA